MSDLDMIHDLQIVLEKAVLCGHERAELEMCLEKGGMTEYKYQSMLKNHMHLILENRDKQKVSKA